MKSAAKSKPANLPFITLQILLGIGAGLWYADRVNSEGKTLSESLFSFYLFINIIFFAVVASTGCIHAFLMNRMEKIIPAILYSLLTGISAAIVFWLFLQILGAPFLFLPLLGYVFGFHLGFRNEKGLKAGLPGK